MSSHLDRLINSVKEDPEYGDWIPHRGYFIKSLEDLQAMIGNSKTKDDIAKQIMTLINKKGKNSFMINTVLYGPPGVGKTRLATHLAHIWTSMGFLDKEEKKEDIATRALDNVSMDTIGPIILACSLILSGSRYVYNKGGLPLLVGSALILLVAGLYLYRKKNNREINVTSVKKYGEESIISVVSGEDFIDKWMGWTKDKTTKLLKANHGRVLFIDEAYSLVSSERDQYGKEALDVLNRYLSENPRKIIVVMAGYRDRMEPLFRLQPGLDRRFMWKFDCSGYTLSELFSIFKLQLHKEGLELENNKKIIKLFNDISLFPSQAGDTERLVNYCETEHVTSGKNNNTIDYEDVVNGLKQLKNNSSFVKPKSKQEEVIDMLTNM
jgi:replication-associated recombination protein RarA